MTALACLASACQSDSRSLISGKIEGVASDSLVLIVHDTEGMRTERIDTIAMTGGVFEVEMPDTVLKQITIAPVPGNGKQLFSDNPDMISTVFKPGEQLVVNGTLKEYQIGGSKFYQEMAAVVAPLKPLTTRLTDIRYRYADLMKEATNRDSLQAEYEKEYNSLMEQVSDVAMKYIKANPDNDFSAYMLPYLGEDMEEGLALLTERVKEGPLSVVYKPLLKMYRAQKEREKNAEAIQPGKPAPDFTLNDLEGKPLSLSSLRGKHVVLDFWGSWCGWCIKGFPEMKKAYAKHSGKVEFVGIDCNDTEQKWKDAVAKHELPWLNVRNEGDLDVSALYAVGAYPTKCIIDPDGNIVKVVVGEDPEFYTFLDDLLK